MEKPNFFIVGAAKAGTTSLARYLSKHPDIYIPPEKELRYYVRKSLRDVNKCDPMIRDIIENSILDSEKYFQVYDVPEQLAGDASVHYLYHFKEVIPEILSTVGDVPIIIMIREPVDRLISHYNFLPSSKGRIEEEIARENEKIEKGFNSFWYLKALGFYAEGINAYMSSFSKVKVITFESFISDPESQYRDCLNFLGAKQYYLGKYDVHNKTVKPRFSLFILSKLKVTTAIRYLIPGSLYLRIKRKLFSFLYSPSNVRVSDNLRRELSELYAKEIENLKDIPGVDVTAWLSPAGSRRSDS